MPRLSLAPSPELPTRALAVAVSAAAAGVVSLLVGRASSATRPLTAALMVVRPLAAGAPLTAANVRRVWIASPPTATVPHPLASLPAPHAYARTPLPPGTLLTSQSLSSVPAVSPPPLPPGQVAVAVTVPRALLPFPPRPGATVALAGQLTPGGAVALLKRSATVLATQALPASPSGPASVILVLALPLPQALAVEAAQHAAALYVLPWSTAS
jgi:hypothetical protein